jgi:hypothetical protein
VTGFDGRPTDEQVARSDALGRELDDVVREFTTLTSQQLPALNRQLTAKKLGTIEVLAEEAWRNAHQQP